MMRRRRSPRLAAGNRMTAPLPPNRLSLSVVNRIEELGATADAVEAFLVAWKVDPGDRAQVMLILDEITSNIIHSAWPDGGVHKFLVDLAVVEHSAHLSLVMLAVDDGVAFDPTAIPPPDLTQDIDDRVPGGLGLFLVGEMSDAVEYHRIDGQNRLQISKVLQRTEQPV